MTGERDVLFYSSPEKISKRSMALWKDPLAPPVNRMMEDSYIPGGLQKKDQVKSSSSSSNTTAASSSSSVASSLTSSPFKQTIEDSVTLMATSWLENRFSKILWILLLAGPLAVSYYTHSTLGVSLTLALVAGLCTHSIVPEMGRLLLAADLSGKDLNKIGQPKLAESLGIAAGSIFLISMFLFIPFPFLNWMQDQFSYETTAFETLGNYTAAMLSISAMLFLGFADDVINLKWRHKVLLPAMAALPLLMIYKLTSDRTEVVVPIPLRWLLLDKAIIDIGFLYYIYMAMLSVFCTHSINILAGVNGVEVGQSVVIGSFIILNNLLMIFGGGAGGDSRIKSLHYFSLFLMVPFVSVSGALLNHNWFPASVFVGDTFCYFAGMTFAVAGILGHFSKTLLLFFVPQVFNFIISVPQLFGLVPCPRHRLPRLNRQSGKLEASTVVIVDHNKLSRLGRVSIEVLSGLRIVRIVKMPSEGNPSMICTNFTLLSTLLNVCGPLREDHLAITVMVLQGTCCTVGLLIRHLFSKFVF